MKSKVCIFTAFILSILFTSCFSNFKTQRETSVTFNLDKETVSKILKSSINNSSSRAAAGTTADFFIDVSLCGDFEQTKTVPVEDEIHVEFTEVPVNSRVYAKAQIFKYTDSQKTEKNVIYRGQSQTIVVRDTGNVLSIKLGVAALTITFDSNGGTQIVQQTVITGDCAQEPANPVKPIDKSKYSRENFAFAGWYTDAELTNAYNFDLPVTDDLTLYAKWLPDFVFVEGKVLYDYQDLGNTVRILDLFVSDHEVTQAEYYAVTNKAPSIHQDENGTASELPVENVTWFDALAYCNLLSIKENLTPCYKINGSFVPLEWGTPNAQTSVTCNAAANGYRIPSEAEWEYIAQKGKRVNTNFSNLAYTQENSGDKTHKVKINLADELCLCDIYGNVAEWCFDIYSATAKTRVIKGGSYQTAAADCTPEARSGLDPLQSNGTTGFRVVRTYVNEFKPLTNKVTFDSNGGSAVDTQIINNGETAVQPGIPVKEGYNFAGWYEQSTGQAFDFATLILQDIVLQARWSAISYTISYDLNGGDSNDPDNPSSYTIESDTILLKPASRTSYNFTGWYNGTEPVEKIITGSTGNVSLTAHWTQCHIVTFDTNGGSTVNSQEVEDQNYATIPAANPTRTGYNFVRWYTTNQNTAYDFEGTPVTGNITIYALWDPIEYKVIYHLDGGTITGTQYDSANDEYYTTYTIAETSDIVLPTPQPPSTGVFDGWYTTASFDASSVITKIEQGSYGNRDVYAKWKYSMTFQLISGDWSSSNPDSLLSMTVTVNGTVVDDSTPLSGTTIEFTPSLPNSDYTCNWYVDGREPDTSWTTVDSTTNIFTITPTTNTTTGIYDIHFTADGPGSNESYYAQIRIN